MVNKQMHVTEIDSTHIARNVRGAAEHSSVIMYPNT